MVREVPKLAPTVCLVGPRSIDERIVHDSLGNVGNPVEHVLAGATECVQEAIGMAPRQGGAGTLNLGTEYRVLAGVRGNRKALSA